MHWARCLTWVNTFHNKFLRWIKFKWRLQLYNSLTRYLWSSFKYWQFVKDEHTQDRERGSLSCIFPSLYPEWWGSSMTGHLLNFEFDQWTKDRRLLSRLIASVLLLLGTDILQFTNIYLEPSSAGRRGLSEKTKGGKKLLQASIFCTASFLCFQADKWVLYQIPFAPFSQTMSRLMFTDRYESLTGNAQQRKGFIPICYTHGRDLHGMRYGWQAIKRTGD